MIEKSNEPKHEQAITPSFVKTQQQIGNLKKPVYANKSTSDVSGKRTLEHSINEKEKPNWIRSVVSEPTISLTRRVTLSPQKTTSTEKLTNSLSADDVTETYLASLAEQVQSEVLFFNYH